MKKPKIPKKLNKVISRRKKTETSVASSPMPKITNETVAEHREEVLSSARKYIYPLQHSRHRIVIISVTIFVVVLLAFFSYSMMALYKFNTTSGFMYRVTSVLPFPVARAGSRVVSYNSYLFELRRYLHYYETQQKVDFADAKNQAMLVEFRKRSLDNVIKDAYIKQIAKSHGISVGRAEIEARVDLLKSQNRLGSGDEVLGGVLQEFWGWSYNDFRQVLKQELLAQKVANKLDEDAQKIAAAALAQIQAGGDFSALAKQYSQDVATKDGGGNYGYAIDRSNRDLEPEVIDKLFKTQPGQTTGIVETANGFEIIKVLEKTPDGKVQAAHIFIGVKPIQTYVDQLMKEQKTWHFISV